VVVCYLRYGDTHWMFESPRLDQFPFTRPPGWGFSLPMVYLIWAGIVLTMYPLCARMARQRPAGRPQRVSELNVAQLFRAAGGPGQA
jgi:hypothetical protein